MAYRYAIFLVGIRAWTGNPPDGRFSPIQLQIHDSLGHEGLTMPKGGLKYRKFRRKQPSVSFVWRFSGSMTTKSTPSSPSRDLKLPCKHPRVQIVSRDEDCEFVECKECGEIFESSEFKDMNIEERAQGSKSDGEV
jgi:hypothetical protein